MAWNETGYGKYIKNLVANYSYKLPDYFSVGPAAMQSS